MENKNNNLNTANWEEISNEINEKGYAVIPQMISNKQCDELIKQYDNENLYRKKIVMERYRFGLGEYKYFNYPLPNLLQEIREQVYPKLVPVANNWMKALNIDKIFPETHLQLLEQCHQKNQKEATLLILKYGKGGYNTLHQDLYGEVFFPFQTVLFLNEKDKDYKGGEFVLVQQNPRAQSKAIVVNANKGDMLIFTTNFRPVKAKKGYSRVNMKHGVSEIHTGERYTLGIIFHDALT
jgi:hypothetical protein